MRAGNVRASSASPRVPSRASTFTDYNTRDPQAVRDCEFLRKGGVYLHRWRFPQFLGVSKIDGTHRHGFSAAGLHPLADISISSLKACQLGSNESATSLGCGVHGLYGGFFGPSSPTRGPITGPFTANTSRSPTFRVFGTRMHILGGFFSVLNRGSRRGSAEACEPRNPDSPPPPPSRRRDEPARRDPALPQHL